MRVLVHAGFHKTGTKSVQDMLRLNRALLDPVLRIALKEDMPDLAAAARRSAFDAAAGRAVEPAAQAWIATVDADDPRPLLVSCEDLAGCIPGRRGIAGYPRAAENLRLLAALMTGAWGKGGVAFCLTTRGAEAWLKSCHAQHVRHDRMRESRAAYMTAHREAGDLTAVAAAVRAAVAPCPVHEVTLEESRLNRLGPLDPLLDLVKLDPAVRSRLTALPPSNAALPDAVLDEMLALNRGDLPAETLRRRKRALALKSQVRA